MTRSSHDQNKRAVIKWIIWRWFIRPARISHRPARMVLANPQAASADELTCALSASSRTQFLVVSASSAGCPINCNVPGTYDIPALIHPAQAEFASTPISLGGSSINGAKIWASLSDSVRARTNFFPPYHLSNSTRRSPKIP